MTINKAAWLADDFLRGQQVTHPTGLRYVWEDRYKRGRSHNSVVELLLNWYF